jgi:hypothetical protein
VRKWSLYSNNFELVSYLQVSEICILRGVLGGEPRKKSILMAMMYIYVFLSILHSILMYLLDLTGSQFDLHWP